MHAFDACTGAWSSSMPLMHAPAACLWRLPRTHALSNVSCPQTAAHSPQASPRQRLSRAAGRLQIPSPTRLPHVSIVAAMCCCGSASAGAPACRAASWQSSAATCCVVVPALPKAACHPRYTPCAGCVQLCNRWRPPFTRLYHGCTHAPSCAVPTAACAIHTAACPSLYCRRLRCLLQGRLRGLCIWPRHSRSQGRAAGAARQPLQRNTSASVSHMHSLPLNAYCAPDALHSQACADAFAVNHSTALSFANVSWGRACCARLCMFLTSLQSAVACLLWPLRHA